MKTKRLSNKYWKQEAEPSKFFKTLWYPEYDVEIILGQESRLFSHFLVSKKSKKLTDLQN